MALELKSALVTSMETAAAQAGLVLLSAASGSDLHGQPTAVFQLALRGDESRTLRLELSEAFDFDKPLLLPAMTAHLGAEAKRLRNPAPRLLRYSRRYSRRIRQIPVALPPLHLRGRHLHRARRNVPGRRRRAKPARQTGRLRHRHLCRDCARHGAALR